MGGREAIYLDYHATTPVDPRVAEVVCRTLRRTFGNPNSVDHVFGSAARQVLEEARVEVGGLVGAEPSRVILTSGATEAIRLAIADARISRAPSRPLRVIASPVEHRAVLDILQELVRVGAAEVRFLTVDRAGRIDLEELRRASVGAPDLICVMAANNEVGTIYPVARIAALATDAGAAALVDATQAVGKITLDVDRWGITYLALSAHKIYGPKGAGALVVGPGNRDSVGHAEGTPNVPAIAGLAEACRLRRLEMDADERRIAAMRNRLEACLAEAIPDLVVNGALTARLSGNLHFSIPGVPNGPVLTRLHDHVALSSGSACMSGAEAPSHVLLALGLEDELVDGALRIGLGKFTTDDEIDLATTLILGAVAAVREAMIGTRQSAAASRPTELRQNMVS